MSATQLERTAPIEHRPPAPTAESGRRAIPPLQAGDRLARPEFERRYQARPDVKKAELIEGVVYMPSPVQYRLHGTPGAAAVGWLGVYSVALPGVRVADNVTVRLDMDNEPQPDALLRLPRAMGGASWVTEDDYLAGAPELIVEVAASSAAYDLHDKLHAYRRNGVQEYLVLLAHERQTRWHVLREGVYELLEADARGVLRSQVFPGLWLDSARYWADDLAGLLAVLQEGLNSQEHSAFAARVREAIETNQPLSSTGRQEDA